MQATIWLLGCVLAPAQPPTRPAAAPALAAPRPGRPARRLGPHAQADARAGAGLPRHVHRERPASSRVEFQRAYRIESRIFAVETDAARHRPRLDDPAVHPGAVRRQGRSRPRPRPACRPASVRLERLTLDLQGKVSAPPGVSLAVPLDGAPPLEVGAFLEWPRGRLAVNQGWEIPEAGRPLMAWRLVGTETVAGQTCVKVVGLQKSDDWEQPRADRSAWRREEVLWISPRDGFTMRLERTLEQREPARREVTRRGVLRYDLESSMQYPAIMAQDRRAEISQALKLRDEARALVGDPVKNAKAIGALQRRIAGQVENTPPTPYRACVLQVKRMVEAAGRGEVVTVSPHRRRRRRKRPRGSRAIGQPAPHFVASDVAGGGTSRLLEVEGQAHRARLLQPRLGHRPGPAAVQPGPPRPLGQVLLGRRPVRQRRQGEGRRPARRPQADLPPLYGSGLRISYKVETTPKLVLIDAAGLVRGMYFGWGRETPERGRRTSCAPGSRC